VVLKFALVLIVTACSGGGSPSRPTTGGTPTPTASCTPAPAWLVAAIQSGITTKGAKLSGAYIAPATNFVFGPPIVLSSKFAKSWWVGGRINGGGVDDEVATWVTNGMSESDPALIFAVSAAARRYSEWGADVQGDIAGDGELAVRTCVG
jgi:hypothetical protein